MSTSSDTYKTISKSSQEILFKEKKSKFYGYAYPIGTENDIKPLLEKLKQKHPTANHVCYAWQLGIENTNYRANDDGEPNNSAGMPIYGQIQSFEITNALVAVARVYGGVKLGVGGLINAYRTTAQMTLNASYIVEKIITQQFQISFNYTEMNKVMRIIKQKQLEIVSQKHEMNCELQILVRKNEADAIKAIFKSMHRVNIKTMKP